MGRFVEEIARRYVGIIKRRTLSVDLAVSGDGDIPAVFRGDQTLPAVFGSKIKVGQVVEIIVKFRRGMSQKNRTRFQMQFHVVFQIDRAGEIRPGREYDTSAAVGGCRIDRILDGIVFVAGDEMIHTIKSFLLTC